MERPPEAGPHIIFDKELLDAPYSVQFNKEKYTELLKDLKMDDQSIDTLTVRISGKRKFAIAGMYNQLSHDLAVYVGTTWNHSNNEEYVNRQINNTLLHESRHASENKLEKLQGWTTLIASAGLVYAGGAVLEKLGIRLSSLQDRYKMGLFTGGLVLAYSALYFTPLNQQEHNARNFEASKLDNEKWSNIITLQKESERRNNRLFIPSS